MYQELAYSSFVQLSGKTSNLFASRAGQEVEPVWRIPRDYVQRPLVKTEDSPKMSYLRSLRHIGPAELRRCSLSPLLEKFVGLKRVTKGTKVPSILIPDSMHRRTPKIGQFDGNLCHGKIIRHWRRNSNAAIGSNV